MINACDHFCNLSHRLTTLMASFRRQVNRITGRMDFMPVMFLSLTGKCDSKCVLCSIWKGPGNELEPSVIEAWVSGSMRLGMTTLIITGGEPLMRDDLSVVLDRLSGRGLNLVLCTNGMLLNRHRETVMKYFASVVISLDAHDPSTYKAIRGVDAFDEVISGITSIAAGGRLRVSIAHTLQKANVLQLADFIAFAKGLPVESISVRPIDAYSNGFGSEYGQGSPRNALLPSEDQQSQFSEILVRIGKDFSEELTSGFINPDIRGLRKIQDYLFANKESAFPGSRCSAPYSSCVIESNGEVKHCFFSKSFTNVNSHMMVDIKRIMNSDDARRARKGLDGHSGICRRCAYPYIWL